jgi:hypothetical protein
MVSDIESMGMDEKEKKLLKKRSRLLFEFDMLNQENPREANRIIMVFVLSLIMFLIIYLGGYYLGIL